MYRGQTLTFTPRAGRGQRRQRPQRRPNIVVQYQNRNQRRQNNTPGTNAPNPSTSGVNLQLTQNRRWNPRRRRTQNGTHQVISKREKWFDVKQGAHKYEFLPGKSGVPHLDRFSNIYENYKLTRMQIQFTPAAGTSVPGSLTMGIDYNSGDASQPPRAAKDIPLLDQNTSGAIFQRASMRAVPDRIMKGKTWLSTAVGKAQTDYDSISFALYVHADTDASIIGQIWVSYTIQFNTATAPAGGIEAQGTPLAFASSTVTDNIQVSPARNYEFGNSKQTPYSVVSPTQTVKATESETHLETKIALDPALQEGDIFTVGSSQTIQTGLYFANRTPSITFTYDDGTPVPAGVIVPISQAPTIYAHQNAGIFATIFSILKPLIRPVITTLLDIFVPVMLAPGEEPPVILDQPLSDYTAFAFEGDTAHIVIPAPVAKTLSTSAATELIIFGGKDNRKATFNNTKTYAVTSVTPSNNWFKKSVFSSTDINSPIWLTFANPSSQNSFHLGDYFTLHLYVFTPDGGFAKDFTPYIKINVPRANEDILSNVVATESFLSNDPDPKSSDTAKIHPKVLYSVNKTEQTAPKDQKVGLFYGFQFVSETTLTSQSFEYFHMRLDTQQIFSAVTSDKFSPSTLGDISRPDENYYNIMLSATTIFFPSTHDLKPAKTEQEVLAFVRPISPVRDAEVDRTVSFGAPIPLH